MVLHRQTLNYKFTITTHQNILRVSGNEKKTNIAKYLKNEYIYIYIYIYIYVYICRIFPMEYIYKMNVTNKTKNLLTDY